MAKKGKKVIKDSVDVEQIQEIKETEKKETKSTTAEQQVKTKKTFKEKYVQLVSEYKIPVASYCYQLFHKDLKEFKKDPTALTSDTTFIKNATTKKRFFIKLSYLISMIFLGILFITLGILIVSQVIPTGGIPANGRSYLSAGLMAIGVVMIGIFI